MKRFRSIDKLGDWQNREKMVKLVRFGPAGHERPGCIGSDGVIRDLSSNIRDLDSGSLADGALADLASIDIDALPEAPAGSRLGPCVGKPGKLVCVGLNYEDHVREAGMTVPAEPVLFMKSPTALGGPNDDIPMPRGATKMDWEVELGVVIGREGRYIEEDRALDHVAGYCTANDVSERAFQLEGSGQWLKGKSSDGFLPLGPWLVTPEEVSDPGNLGLWLSVNGERCQDSSTGQMIFKIPFLIGYISRFMRLMPGDVICTGTPAGVGMGLKPPLFLKAGDVVELEVDGLGRQAQRIVA
jgi:2,4-diketo-3-deoxy-L-fuconate hydrolase